jgi:hypothetical protein
MDYFGKSLETINKTILKDTLLNVESVSIMGKVGILEGGKGDIMIPNPY